MIIEHLVSVAVLFWVGYRFLYPRIKEILINQQTLSNNDKAIHHEIELARKAALEVRDHSTDIKQSVETLNGLTKEAIRNLPRSEGLV